MTAERNILSAFWIVSGIHLAALLSQVKLAEQISKPALMALLAAYAIVRKAPRILTAALALSCVGDALLQFSANSETMFIAGMACFAAAHVNLTVLFIGRTTRGRGMRVLLAGMCYVAIWVSLVTLIWSDLGSLQIAVAAYSIVLAANATFSTAAGFRAGLGGALFFLSDSLVATRLADWPQLPAAGVWVMATYIGAQYLLTSALTYVQKNPPQALHTVPDGRRFGVSR